MNKDKLNSIVKEMLETHKGGEVFFDHLDEAVRDKVIVDDLIHNVTWEDAMCHGIVSGKFGEFFNNFANLEYPSENRGIIVVNGGLRSGEPITDLSCFRDFIKGKSFIFFDDSFYSGKTRDAIKAELERLGGRLSHTYVIYDGSKEKDSDVTSLYRYYNELSGEANLENL